LIESLNKYLKPQNIPQFSNAPSKHLQLNLRPSQQSKQANYTHAQLWLLIRLLIFLHLLLYKSTSSKPKDLWKAAKLYLQAKAPSDPNSNLIQE
jgi:hypothetical protein